jgi:hypothetical protein
MTSISLPASPDASKMQPPGIQLDWLEAILHCQEARISLWRALTSILSPGERRTRSAR